jgi:hypothetical protein
MTDLAQAIDLLLRHSDGPVSLKEIQDLATKGHHTPTQLNQALRELKQKDIELCDSCKSLVRPRTGAWHQGYCPHGA